MQERGNPSLHTLDWYIGGPIVAVLGALRRKRALPSKISTIGLLKPGAIGDTVLLTAIVSDLRRTFPRATLTFFAGGGNLELVQMIEGIDGVIEVPVRNPLAGIRAVRSVAVDVLLDFGQWSRVEALFTLLARAQCTIGFRTERQHRHYGYDISVDHSSKTHELENYRRLIQAIGSQTSSIPELRICKHRSAISREYVVFHLWPGGVRSDLKEWPRKMWLRLAKEICGQGVDVVFTGGDSDRERNETVIAQVPTGMPGSVRNAAGVSLKETCDILANAKLVVSVNTGVMHLAAALKTPLVALHGPTSSRRWGPISPDACVIDSPLPECGYLNLGWEYPANPPRCMEAISYESVRDACRAILKPQIQQIHTQKSQ